MCNRVPFNCCKNDFVLPYYNIVVIYAGAQGLIKQDPPVAHNDASFTAETGRKYSQKLVTLIKQKQKLVDVVK